MKSTKSNNLPCSTVLACMLSFDKAPTTAIGSPPCRFTVSILNVLPVHSVGTDQQVLVSNSLRTLICPLCSARDDWFFIRYHTCGAIHAHLYHFLWAEIKAYRGTIAHLRAHAPVLPAKKRCGEVLTPLWLRLAEMGLVQYSE